MSGEGRDADRPGTWADFIASHDPGDGDRTGKRPLARLVARLVDYALFVTLVEMAVYGMPGAWNPLRSLGPAFGTLVLLALWAPLEAMFLTSAATTPGKFLLGIRVVGEAGDPPAFVTAMKRSIRVWAEGCAGGLPVLSAIAVLRAGLVLNGTGRTPWDAAAGLRVHHRPPRRGKAVGSALAVVGIFLVAAMVEDGASAGRQAERHVAKVVAEIREWAEIEGGEFDVVRELAGELVAGDEHRIAVTLTPGETWAAAVACDDACLDIDLFLVDESGDTLAADARVFEEASVVFEPHAPTPAELVVQMFACAAEPCAYAVRLLRLDPGLATGTGSCFAVTSEILLTARHVVVGRDSVRVRFTDGVDRRARVVSEHPDVDVAVLSLDAGVFGVLPLAERDALYAGAPVFAFGFPAADVLGSEGKVTDGVISALRGPEGEEHLVQTSAPIQPGSSGGPLLDDAGRVVGLVVATLRSDAFYSAVGELPQNVNWAVRADVLRRVLREAGVELPGPDGETTGRRQAVERAAEATCYLETD